MSKRRKMSRGSSKKLFSKTSKVNKRNAPRSTVMRGGIRL